MPRVPYPKPHLTFAQQIELITERGLNVGAESQAIEQLRRIGYYRLSAYWYPFRELRATSTSDGESRGDRFQAGYTLGHAIALYEFDKQLRLLVMDAIERIEISIRVEVANLLGAIDAFAQDNPAILHPKFSRPNSKRPNDRSEYDNWKRSEQDHYWRSSEQFAEHFAERYLLPMPIWISIELWDFGMLSRFFSGMTVAHQETITAYYGASDWQVMKSWLRSLNHARNISAHHSRLWNRNLDDQPKLPKFGTMPAFDHLVRNRELTTSRVYATLCIILHLLDHIDPGETWRNRLRGHINGFPNVPHIGLHHMGFPANWENESIWSSSTSS